MDDELIIDPAKLVGTVNRTFQAPDLSEAVEGWRTWIVSNKPPRFGVTPKLHAVTYQSYFWTPRAAARAECTVDEGHVPGEGCGCGFYSAKTLDHLRTMGYISQALNTPNSTGVVGRLANWGKVIEGTQGWRAEWSYPVHLYVPFEAWRLVKPLREGYGVPVTLLNVLGGNPK